MRWVREGERGVGGVMNNGELCMCDNQSSQRKYFYVMVTH